MPFAYRSSARRARQLTTLIVLIAIALLSSRQADAYPLGGASSATVSNPVSSVALSRSHRRTAIAATAADRRAGSRRSNMSRTWHGSVRRSHSERSRRRRRSGPGTTTTEELETTDAAAPFRFFASTSFWNEPVPADAPRDQSSAGVVGALDGLVGEEEQADSGPWINTTKYSVPVYTVPSDQPTVAVQLVDHDPNAVMSAAWSAVPLPAEAQAAGGTDGDLAVWQPSSDRLWEFWRLGHEGGGWHATWGGAMQNVSSDTGVFGPEAWPGAETWWGVSASSLSLVGGLISLEDLEKGQINHAVSMSIPDVRAGVYASPAQRSDGKSPDPLSLPEGAHLRLDPNLDLAALHLPRVTLLIAEAAQRYGIFITDGAGVVTFQAQDPEPTGTEPYKGTNGYFEGQMPRELLASFPWSHLELLKMELHAVK